MFGKTLRSLRVVLSWEISAFDGAIYINVRVACMFLLHHVDISRPLLFRQSFVCGWSTGICSYRSWWELQGLVVERSSIMQVRSSKNQPGKQFRGKTVETVSEALQLVWSQCIYSRVVRIHIAGSVASVRRTSKNCAMHFVFSCASFLYSL